MVPLFREGGAALAGDDKTVSMLLLKSRPLLSPTESSNLDLLEVTSMDEVKGSPPTVWLRGLRSTGNFLGAAKEGGLGACASLFCIVCSDICAVGV